MKTEIKTKLELGNVLVPVAIVILAASLFFSNGGFGEPKTVSVTGSAEKMVAPDKATVMISVETDGTSASSSQSANKAISDAVISSIKSLDVDKVETTSYSVQKRQEYEPLTGRYVDRGYRASHSISVETNSLDVVGSVIDAAVGSGANRVDNVVFSLSDMTEDRVREELLSEASMQAWGKASILSESLGSGVGGLRSVSESSFYVSPVYKGGFAELASADSATQVLPSEVQVTASVTAVFDLA